MKTVWKIIGGILGVLVLIVIFILEVICYFDFTLNKVITKDNIKDIIKDTTNNDDNITLYNDLINTANELGLPANTTEQIISSDTFANLLATIINNSIEVVIVDKPSNLMTNQEISTLIHDSLDELSTTLNITLTEEDKENIAIIIDDNIDMIKNSIIDTNNIINTNDKSMQLLKYIFSDTIKVALIVTIVMLSLLVALLMLSISNGIMATGIVTTISAIFVIFIGLSPITLLKYISIGSDIDLIIKPVLSSIANTLIQYGIIGSLLGLILIILAIILRKRKALH